MTIRNLSSQLRRRRSVNPMREYDALPPELRQWLSQARLPWSARSARRIWNKAVQDGGAEAALARLEAAEIATLRRDDPLGLPR
ncbi:DUF6525 family protein [Actibacterium atlanticum]|uniref:DUF6525 family protein n=1 Tax=Actibacterium atlanticum TaxID=1461693 RepID=UPI000551CB3B|nr:DUF6525 family protein [Actibacterium atlanticum]